MRSNGSKTDLLINFTLTSPYLIIWRTGSIAGNWISQHLRIKVFYGTSENTVKTQRLIAISIYVQVANIGPVVYKILN